MLNTNHSVLPGGRIRAALEDDIRVSHCQSEVAPEIVRYGYCSRTADAGQQLVSRKHEVRAELAAFEQTAQIHQGPHWNT